MPSVQWTHVTLAVMLLVAADARAQSLCNGSYCTKTRPACSVTYIYCGEQQGMTPCNQCSCVQDTEGKILRIEGFVFLGFRLRAYYDCCLEQYDCCGAGAPGSGQNGTLSQSACEVEPEPAP